MDMIQPLPFSLKDYRERLSRLATAIEGADLVVLILFSQESLYYLFGYDQIGYWVYQAVVVWPDGREPVAIARVADEGLIRNSGLINDVRLWFADDDRSPGRLTADVARAGAKPGPRIGIEKQSHALLASHYDELLAGRAGAR